MTPAQAICAASKYYDEFVYGEIEKDLDDVAKDSKRRKQRKRRSAG